LRTTITCPALMHNAATCISERGGNCKKLLTLQLIYVTWLKH